MFTRILSSALIGAAVTCGLLFLMQYLIASGEAIVIDDREPSLLTWVALDIVQPVIVNPVEHKRPDPAPIPPITNPQGPIDTGGVGIPRPGPTMPPPVTDATISSLSLGDGPLVKIFLVEPQYPAIAIARGLDGTVLVRYDVSAIGTVENVVVIESSNSIFNKAAIAAAYRFKYKPKMIDGVPYATKGLRNLFRFEIEK